jgi:oligosaccharide reducing-end xylanase
MKTSALFRAPFLPVSLLFVVAACAEQSEIPPLRSTELMLVANPPTDGAVESGVYRNLFVDWLGITPAVVDAKLDALWSHYFEGGATAKLYYADGSNANGPKAYIYDTGNRDIRSEGMGYGMMIAVQMDKKGHFDAIWNWAKTNMQYQGGEWDGYFAWQCDRQGNVVGQTPASDGEEYMATALFFAAHRWGNGSGIYAYEAEANRILNTMLHKEDMNGGVINGVTNMFDTTEQQVVFVPYFSSAEHTNPSYHLPAFYELWGRWAAGYDGQQAADRQFWLDAAATSRWFFGQTTHPSTALNPDYAYFTGEPHPDWEGDPLHMDFRHDAWRTAVNWSVDYAWWAADANETVLSDRLLSFFYSEGIQSYGSLFTLDGAELDGSHALGLVASNGAAALAATTNSDAHAGEFVQELWNTEPKFGNYRYYDGLLQFMAFLHVSGNFRAYLPSGGCQASELSCVDGLDDDCDEAIDCADPDCSGDAACDVCGNGICGSGEDACSCQADCGTPPPAENECADGFDEDCDGTTDCQDEDCVGSAECSCQPLGASCADDAECCRGKCKGPAGGKTCK